MLKKSIILGITCLLMLSSNVSLAQISEPKEPTRIMFLLDASQSMVGRWESGTKYDIAQRLLSEIVDSINNVNNVEMALRVYGHTKNYPPQDCDDTRLEVPFASGNAYAIKKKLGVIKPSGTTPIAMSIEECGKDFPDTKGRNIIIIITDGIEECDGDPCAVSYALQKKGIVLKPFVIGMGIRDDFIKQFECVGNYYDAGNEESFRTIFNVVISQALNNTTAQVNLIDAYGKPTETNVNMSFYDNNNGKLVHNFVHTMNAKGVPDTVPLDPSIDYRIVAHTLPPVTLDSAGLNPGKHTTIGLNTPQGDLFLKITGTNQYKKLKCIIRKDGEQKTLHVQDFSTTQRFLVGTYDLEVLCLPRLYVEDVEIAQSKTTTVEIPNPGLITILTNSKGYGSIYKYNKDEIEWVCDLTTPLTKETLVLQPGQYKAVYRPTLARKSIYTVEQDFIVSSGASKSITLK
ncbi:MAG: VWA domain-containing protein [Bacteroidia bacterium]|nr:VWA domain-containing protein [Bacteroidia bacterium]